MVWTVFKYLGIIDTRLWVSLIVRFWYLGIIDTRVGYLRLCMHCENYSWMTHPQNISSATIFFTCKAHMYPASLNFCSSSWKSLPHCPVHEEARKEPLNESLENQHYDAPCAQQSPTSFNGLRRKSPCRLCSCMTAWKDKPAWRKLNLPHKDASTECQRIIRHLWRTAW